MPITDGYISRQGTISNMLVFQVLSPDFDTILLPEALVLTPKVTNVTFNYSKVTTKIQTLGGFVIQHFGDALSSISVSSTVGAFVSVEHGYTDVHRASTAAYQRFLQLLSIYESNGNVYDQDGQVQFSGRIRLTFMGGVFDGYFTEFSTQEDATNPYTFTADFGFRVTSEVRSVAV